jgi:DNA-binding PadR family transcriptional regulator
MTAFGFGAEEFEVGLSEAVDRARSLLRNLNNLGSESMTRSAGGPFGREHAGPHEHPHAEPHEDPQAGPWDEATHEHAAAHGHAGARMHSEPGPDDEPGEGGSWSFPGNSSWTAGFGGKDWAGLFGGPRGGWWPGAPGPGPRRGWGGPGRPGGPGGRGPGGPGGPRRPKASRGDVRATILALLTEGPRTGYQIMSDIEERSRGAWRPSPGAVYPALQLLADEELIIGDEAGGRRTYRLTEAGREYVTANPEMARGAWESMAGSDEFGPGDLPRLFGEAARLGAAIAQLAHAGTPDQIRAAERLIKRTRREMYEVLAGDDDTEDEADAEDEAGSARE